MTYMHKLIPLALTGFLFGAPAGNPISPALLEKGFLIPENDWANFRLGYEGDFVVDARMKQIDEGSGRVDDFDQATNSGTFTLSLFNHLDLFGVLGASRVESDWRFSVDPSLFRAEVETEYDLSYGAGLRAMALFWKGLGLGVEGRYMYASMTPSWLTLNGASQDVAGANLTTWSWQGDLLLSYTIDFLTPYVGIQYLMKKAELGPFPVPISNHESGRLHMETKSPIGLVLGCSIANHKYFFLNIEGRFVDEEAVSLSGDLRF